VASSPYVDLFESRNGTRTCSIPHLVGTATSPERPMERRSFDVTFTVICDWRNGRVVRQTESPDNVTLASQLAG